MLDEQIAEKKLRNIEESKENLKQVNNESLKRAKTKEEQPSEFHNILIEDTEKDNTTIETPSKPQPEYIPQESPDIPQESPDAELLKAQIQVQYLY